MSKLYGIYKAAFKHLGAFSGWVCTEENFKEVVSKIIEDEGYLLMGGKLLCVEKQPACSNKGVIEEDCFKLVVRYEDLYKDIEQITWIMIEIKTL